MDIHTMFPQDLQITDEYEYSFGEFEYKGDGFYHEIREQVLQLTAEEDDYDEGNNQEIKSPKMVAAKRGFCNVPFQTKGGYYNLPENKDVENSPPTWIVNLWRYGNGTGVFIPQIAPSGRKKRSRTRKGQKRKEKQGTEKNNKLD